MAAEIHILPVIYVGRTVEPDPAALPDLTNVVFLPFAFPSDLLPVFGRRRPGTRSLLPPLEVV